MNGQHKGITMFEKFIKKIFGSIENQTQSNGLPLVQHEAPPMPKVKTPRPKSKKTTPKIIKTESLSPKEIATRKKEPWVEVVQTHINKSNIRNGFFELDWNEYFILQLKQEGYGFDGDPDEEIVDRWFRDLAQSILSSEGQMDSSSGLVVLPSQLTE